ncbi:hypothetical protein PFISCL1PPCAC_18601, partial [Pristionchus fissidentatus]
RLVVGGHQGENVASVLVGGQEGHRTTERRHGRRGMMLPMTVAFSFSISSSSSPSLHDTRSSSSFSSLLLFPSSSFSIS